MTNLTNKLMGKVDIGARRLAVGILVAMLTTLGLQSAYAQEQSFLLNIELVAIEDAGGTIVASDADQAAGPSYTLEYKVTVKSLTEDNPQIVRIEVTYDTELTDPPTEVFPTPDDNGDENPGMIVWSGLDFSVSDSLELGFKLKIAGSLTHGSSAFAPNVSLFLEENDEPSQETKAAGLPLVGANLLIDDVVADLQTDKNINGNPNPGDTLLVTILYSNIGLGESQPITLAVDFTQEAVADLGDTSGGIEDLDTGRVTWEIAVLQPGAVEQVSFNLTLMDEDTFPEGTTNVNINVEIFSDNESRGKKSVSVPISLISIVAEISCSLTLDVDADDAGDVADEFRCSLTIRNFGDINAEGVSVEASYDTEVITVNSALQIEGQAGEISGGMVTWGNLAVNAGGKLDLSFEGEILTIPEGVASTAIDAVLVQQGNRIVFDPQGSIVLAVPGEITEGLEAIAELLDQPEQGTGLIKSESVFVNLIKNLMWLLGVVIVAVLLLPSYVLISKKTETIKLKELVEVYKEIFNHFAGNILEYFLMGMILLVVLLLGVQNAIDREAINSIIGGIVGFIAGRATRA